MDEHSKQSNQEMSSKPTRLMTRGELEKEINQLLSQYPAGWNPCWGWTCVGSLCTIHLAWVCKNDFCSINDNECGDISIMLEVSALEVDIDAEFCDELNSEVESIRISQEVGKSKQVDCARLEEICSRRYDREILDGWVFAMHGATNRVAEPTRMGWSIIENVLPREQCSFSLSDNTGKGAVMKTNGWSEIPEIEHALAAQDEMSEQDIAKRLSLVGENEGWILSVEKYVSDNEVITEFVLAFENELEAGIVQRLPLTLRLDCELSDSALKDSIELEFDPRYQRYRGSGGRVCRVNIHDIPRIVPTPKTDSSETSSGREP